MLCAATWNMGVAHKVDGGLKYWVCGRKGFGIGNATMQAERCGVVVHLNDSCTLHESTAEVFQLFLDNYIKHGVLVLHKP